VTLETSIGMIIPGQPSALAARVFRDSVKKRIKGRYRFGVFLSGGLDSRCITAMMHELNASMEE
jgi:asparagine synthetase B (glutamine-hydrolysing)